MIGTLHGARGLAGASKTLWRFALRRFTKRLPSPALAVAFVALLAALGGTAVALPGKNTVDSGDLKKGAVKGADIAKNAVNGAKIKNGAVGSGDVKNDGLTGTDINEGTLGQVPSAATAGSANSANTANSANSAGSVDGASFVRINYRGAEDSPAVDILKAAGLTVTANCNGGSLVIAMVSNVDDSMAHWAVNQLDSPLDDDDDGQQNRSEDKFSLYEEDDSFDSGNTLLIDETGTGSAAPDSIQGTFTFTNPAGQIVTATFLGEEDSNALGGTADCFVIGHAQVS